ncbi:MAG: hypothetical protein IKT81_04115 [Clostridia bacterium]|nr:hypothetical protein [Clostridia bacterium]
MPDNHGSPYPLSSALQKNNKDAYRNFMQDCMKENLNHARHIENERHNFLSLHLVVVGLFMGAILSPDTSPWISLILSTVLLMFSNIMQELFKRWDRVYNAHLDTAKRLARMIDNDCEQLDDPKFCPIDEDKTSQHHPNYFYYFDNNAGKSALAARAKREKELAEKEGREPAFKDYKDPPFRDSWRFGKNVYTRTHSLYLRFCHLVSLIEIMALVLSIGRIIKNLGLIEMILERI